MRKTIAAVAGCCLLAGAAFAADDASKSMKGMSGMSKGKGMSNSQKIRVAMSAGPADIARNATIIDMSADGKMTELRKGSNGWVCMAEPEIMCLDKEWQGWADAWINKKDPQVKGLGIAYMLKGDKGASNTDPYATAATAGNQWIVTPAHMMVLTPDMKQLDALPTDPHTGGPWVMWKGTKYAHIMVPISPVPAAAKKPASK
jgi:hypothetical protein